MRLITRITLVYLVLTLAVFAVGAVMAYLILQQEVDAEHQRFLRRRIDRAVELIEQGAPLQGYDGDKLEVVPLPAGTPPDEGYRYADTMVWHTYLQRLEQHYKVSAVRVIHEQPYYIETYDVIVESDDIMESVIKSLVRTYLLLLLVVTGGGLLASARIFRPFNDTLNKIRDFRIGSKEPLRLLPTRVREFRRLNRFVEEMANRTRREYQAQKEFSENASHEIQTPISVAQNNLERVMESPGLGEQDVVLIASAQQSLQKLSRLGHSLSLLTRIDNEEFVSREAIPIGEVVGRLLPNFRELAEMKGLQFNAEVDRTVELRIDPTLADILVSNLLQNAIRHNLPNGSVDLKLNRQGLHITNTGPAPTVPPAELFRRFRKENQSSASLGLGLAIVKRICERNQLSIRYDFQDGEHQIVVHFPDPEA